jgi:AraC-like DNA-binding protein
MSPQISAVGSGAPALASRVLTTDAVEAQHRYEYWRDLYSGFVDVDVASDLRRDFWAFAETWQIGPFAVMSAKGAAKRFLRSSRQCARDDRDLWVFRLSPTTAWSAAHADRGERIPAGALWMKRTTRASLTDLPPGEWRVLMFPSHACPELTAVLSRLEHGVLEGPGAGLLADLLCGLPARLRALPETESGALADTLRALIAACLLSGIDPTGAPRIAGGPLTRERVMRVIEDNIGSALLDVDRICRLTNVSRTVLYRMFEAEGGVAHFVRERRLRLIFADLRNPALNRVAISEIAERRGFHNAPSFSRAFRRAFGCSPSEARAAAMVGAPTVASRLSQPERVDVLGDLLARV